MRSFFSSTHRRVSENIVRRQRSFFKRFRDYFLTGLVVAMPFFLTVAFAKWMIDFADSQVIPLIEATSLGRIYILPTAELIPGIGLIIFVLSIIMIGALTAGFIGRYILRFGENIVNRMPVLRVIYSTAKQIFNSIINNQSSEQRQPVLIEYPRKGCWAVAFATSKVYSGIVKEVKKDLICVFVPTTPNPTSGFLLLYPEKELVYLDITSEEAVKMIISGGILQPDA